MPTERLAKFLFEVASPERISILRALRGHPLRHAEITEQLSMTGSETTRHLNRLVAIRMIEKDPEGRYRVTPLAELMLVALPLFDFVSQRDDYLVAHDLSVLEPKFIARLGELNDARLIDGTYPVIAYQDAALREARTRIWVVTDHPFQQALPLLREKASQGTDVRVVRPRRMLQEERAPDSRVERNYAVRLLPEIRIFLAVLDTQAGVSFSVRSGPPDLSSMLLLTDPDGYCWAEDLFLHMWSRAEELRAARPA